MSAQHTPGTWRVVPTREYLNRSWFAVRDNAERRGGSETMRNAAGNPIHFRSEAAAVAAIAKATGAAS